MLSPHNEFLTQISNSVNYLRLEYDGGKESGRRLSNASMFSGESGVSPLDTFQDSMGKLVKYSDFAKMRSEN